MIPEILKILRDEFSNLKNHEMPFCTKAQPLHFELDVIDELSVRNFVFTSFFFLPTETEINFIFSVNCSQRCFRYGSRSWFIIKCFGT